MDIKKTFNDFVNEGKFDGIADLVKSLHFETDPKTAEEKKIAIGKSQGEISRRKQIEGGEYSLRRFRKEIKFGDGTYLGVFLPGSYDAAASTLGDGPHKKAVKKIKWTQKKYDQWLEDMSANGGADNAFDMAQNAKNEPGLIDWVKKNFRGDDALQRIQWDIEAFVESVVTEAKFDKKKLMKVMKADDGMIQLANGEEYVIYAYDNGNDENDAMWNDKSIFALDQDGEEHEVKYSDIVSYNESAVNEASEDRMIKQIERALKDGTSIFKLPMATQNYYNKNKGTFESVVTEAKNTIGLAFKEESDYLDFKEFVAEQPRGAIRKNIGFDSKTKSWNVEMDVKVLDSIYGEGTSGNKESGWYGGLPDDFESVIIESVVTEAAYVNATRNELAQYIINLSNELVSAKSHNNKKEIKYLEKDIAEVKAALDKKKNESAITESKSEFIKIDSYLNTKDESVLIDFLDDAYGNSDDRKTRKEWNDARKDLSYNELVDYAVAHAENFGMDLQDIEDAIEVYESLVTEAKDMTFADYLEVLDVKFEDAMAAVKGENGSDAEIKPTRGDILQNFTLFRNYVSSLTKKYKGDKTRLRFLTECVNEYNGIINESTVNEGKIKYSKGKTYQSDGHWTVYVDSNSSGFDIRVNHSAGWRLDPQDVREETIQLLDNGRQRATLNFKSGNIDKFAQQMFDLNDRTTNGNQTKLTAKDYADIIRVWIDMKMANESVVNEAKLNRAEITDFIEKHVKFVRTTEEFDGSEGGIWVSGESNDKYKGKIIYDYYSEDHKTREFGVLNNWEKELNKLGWYSEWYDAGTVMIWEI